MNQAAIDTLRLQPVPDQGLLIDGQTVPGVLVHSTEGSRRVAAPGLWVFYPFQPFKKGVDVLVSWTVNGRTDTVTFAGS